MEPKFHDPLHLEAIPPDRWRLLLSYRYTTMVLGDPAEIQVRRGFITDLASIPRLITPLLPINSKSRGAAVIHDWLYHTAHDHSYTRYQCDKVFLEASKVAGVWWWRRILMFSGVRAGGWLFFRKRRGLRNG